jgi:hypothetical protein
MKRRRSRAALGAVTAALLSLGLVLMASQGEARTLGKGLRVGCENTELMFDLYVKPRTCVIYSLDRSSASSMDLHRLRWSRWSSKGAVATGVSCGFRARCNNTKVRIVLSGLKLVHCLRNDYRSFARVRATRGFTSSKPLRLPTCPNDETP